MISFPDVLIIKRTFIFQYLIIDNGFLTLVDAGLRNHTGNILKAIQETGLHHSKLQRILITHSDADHFGAANRLRLLTSCSVLASETEAKALNLGKPSRNLTPRGLERVIYWITARIFSAAPTPVDEIIRPGDILPIWNGLEVLDTRGHTPGHISFFSRDRGVLFAGDSIDLLSGKLRPSSGANTWNKDLAKQSFELQMDLGPKLILAGHGFKLV